MKKQNLKFKVDGGLEKVAKLYAQASTNNQAAEVYWNNPELLLTALSVTSNCDFQLSSGYKELAENLDKIDFKTIAPKTAKKEMVVTVTVTTGNTVNPEALSEAKEKLASMTRHAQTLADQISLHT